MEKRKRHVRIPDREWCQSSKNSVDMASLDQTIELPNSTSATEMCQRLALLFHTSIERMECCFHMQLVASITGGNSPSRRIGVDDVEFISNDGSC